MKVVCDTNVLVSGFLFGGHAREILGLVKRGTLTNFTSSILLQELESVLSRPKFNLRPDQVSGFLQLSRNSFKTVFPLSQISVVKTDPDDDRVLEVAMTAEAEYIISGDRDLLDLQQWRGIRIVSPADFVTKAMRE